MEEPCTTLMATRGCPGRCVFCQPIIRDLFGNTVRCRSPENVEAEARYLRDIYSVASVQFADDSVPVGTEWGDALCEAMKRAALPWAINCRVNSITPPVVRRLAVSGVCKILFGIESGSDAILKRLGKQATREQNRSALLSCRDSGIHVRASVMIGSPGETEHDLECTLDLLQQTRPDSIIVNFTKPTPGSRLFRQFGNRRAGRDDWNESFAKLVNTAAGGLGIDPHKMQKLAARHSSDVLLCELPRDLLESYRVEMLNCACNPPFSGAA